LADRNLLHLLQLEEPVAVPAITIGLELDALDEHAATYDIAGTTYVYDYGGCGDKTVDVCGESEASPTGEE
jgi:hypothetical protein